MLVETSDLLAEAKNAVNKLIDVVNQAEEMENVEEKSIFYHKTVTVAMAELRTPIDKLELIVDKELWPVPCYGELMFEV
jgi:glutamine synthetase